MTQKRGPVLQVEGLDEWAVAGRKLAAVDPGRFRRLLAIANGMVAAYGLGDDMDRSSDLHAVLMKMARPDDSYDS